jgi:hypothetical protein
MGRYILRYSGKGAMPASDVERIRSAPGVKVLDSSSPRMFLVEASPETIRQLNTALPGWTSSHEQMIPLPDSRPKLRSS